MHKQWSGILYFAKCAPTFYGTIFFFELHATGLSYAHSSSAVNRTMTYRCTYYVMTATPIPGTPCCEYTGNSCTIHLIFPRSPLITQNTLLPHTHPTHLPALYAHIHPIPNYAPTSIQWPASLQTTPAHVPVPHTPKLRLGPDRSASDVKTDHYHHSSRSTSLLEHCYTQEPHHICTATLPVRAAPLPVRAAPM
jgi:hypothetical protein